MPVHYGIRNLHASDPDDYPDPVWDVVAVVHETQMPDENSLYYYSEDLFYSEIEAVMLVARVQTKPFNSTHDQVWLGNGVPFKNVGNLVWHLGA